MMNISFTNIRNNLFNLNYFICIKSLYTIYKDKNYIKFTNNSIDLFMINST